MHRAHHCTAELSELFQWRGDAGAGPGLPEFSPEDRGRVGEELSDVLLYTLRLADVCGIDLAAASRAKLAANAAKYPAALCRGRADKYTAYAAMKQHSSQTRA